MKQQYTIELIGDGVIKVHEGQTILDASLQAGIPHYHACGGQAECSTCRILINKGKENLTGQNDKERALKKRIPFPENVRLACQTFVIGENVQVHRMIREEIDVKLYIVEDTLTNLEHIGEEKELALFFLDIRNFTPFIETYLPFDVIHIMRRLFTLFRKVIEMNKGCIIETAGDGFYAVFGFDSYLATAVHHAIGSGFQILKDLQSFNDTYMQKNFRHRFQVGIGVHAGKVITGNIGIGVNNNLTVMGFAVNVAARLQASTQEFNNNFVVSETAFKELINKPQGIRKLAHLRGIHDVIPCYLIGEPYDA
jgi:adenylate cyclase